MTYLTKLKILNDGTEEEPMTYLTKCNNLFQDLDKKWNYQIMLPLLGDFNKEDRDWCNPRRQNIVYNSEKYKDFVREQMKQCYFLHFAGGCYMPNMNYTDNEIIDLLI
jgi:hypothetical protein